jgi:putative copper resistance protein D
MPHWLVTILLAAHVLGATVWVGGAVALTFIAVPAARLLTGEPRAAALRGLGRRWRPIGWGALAVMVATGTPLAVHALAGGDGTATGVFAAKMAAFAVLVCSAFLHDFVLGPRVAREIREGRPPVSRPRLVLAGWVSITLSVTIPVLGVVLAETL